MRWLFVIALLAWACGEHYNHFKDCLDGCDQIRPFVAPSPGIDGSSCSVFKTTAGAEITCTDGTSAQIMNGRDGAMGETGSTGPSGIQGQMGNPGTSIRPVLLCPEVPGAFPEVLLCINDHLYAVYDANRPGEVHYTEVVPGYYRSTDGRECRFRVLTGCEIE